MHADGSEVEALAKALGNDIYSFPFSYRGGFESATGFLLGNGAVPFIFVGEKALFEFIGLAEQSVIDEPEDEASTRGLVV